MTNREPTVKGTKVQGAFGAEKWSTAGALPFGSLLLSLYGLMRGWSCIFGITAKGGYTWINRRLIHTKGVPRGNIPLEKLIRQRVFFKNNI